MTCLQTIYSPSKPDFDVGPGDKFGVKVSLIGDEPLDALTERQAIRLYAGFVAQYDADRDDVDLGLWSSECP